MTPEDLHVHAVRAQAMAYAPYSQFPVGAALLTRSGRVFTGCNIESAAYGCTVCAERVALWKAVSEGERDFVMMVVVSRVGASPCGQCRQVISEFFPRDARVYVGDSQSLRYNVTVDELLPARFGGDDLG